jgi:molecular chaperone DnaK
MRKFVGIDLGTTNSAIAVLDGPRPRILDNRASQPLTRSMVGLRRRPDKDDEVLVGDGAEAAWHLAPRDTVFSVKRLMGRGFDDDEVTRVREAVPYEIRRPADGTGDAVRVVIGGAEYSPAQVSALILGKVKQDAEFRLGSDVTHAVVTVPAYFSQIQRAATREACGLAGIKVLLLLDEPTAAAYAYGMDAIDVDEPKTVAVFDLGGGTFDVSILLCGGQGRPVPISKKGDMWLGGDDFDQVIIDEVLDHISEEHGIDPRENARFMVELHRAAQRAKHQLTSADSTDVLLSGLLVDADRNLVDVSHEITRAWFESHPRVQALVQRASALLEQAILESHNTVDTIDQVFMAGGATAIPVVQEAVKRLVGPDKVDNSVHPKHCVALGAAVVAASMGGIECQQRDPTAPSGFCGHLNDPDAATCERCGAPLDAIRPVVEEGSPDIAPFSYGIQIVGPSGPDELFVFVKRGEQYPTRHPVTHEFRTKVPNLRVIRLPVYGGDDLQHASRNEKQGEACAFLPSGLPAQTPIRVTLWLDVNGIFQLSAHLLDGTDLHPQMVTKGEALDRAITRFAEIENEFAPFAPRASTAARGEIDRLHDRIVGLLEQGAAKTASAELEALAGGAAGLDRPSPQHGSLGPVRSQAG